MRLALFDLDHTILDVDSDHLWGVYVVDNGLADANTYRAQNDAFYEHYIKGTLDAACYNEFVAGVLAKHPRAVLDDHLARYMQGSILPKVRPKALRALAMHKSQGDVIVLTSATNCFVVGAIARYLGIDEVLCTRLETNDCGEFTGKVVGTPNFGAGKIVHLKAYLEGKTFDHISAYSDSKNDLPLLEFADCAVCVNPDAHLTARARQRNWRIVDWAMV